MKPKQKKIKINGESWSAYVITDEEHAQSFGSCLAATVPEQNSIFFKNSHREKSTVIHEITHAYFKYLYLGSTTKIKIDQIEEILCEFMSYKCEEIIRNSKTVFSWLKKA